MKPKLKLEPDLGQSNGSGSQTSGKPPFPPPPPNKKTCLFHCPCAQVGQEVEYSVYSREKGGKVSAEGVKLLSRGSISPPACKEELLNGKVARPLRSVNPDQVRGHLFIHRPAVSEPFCRVRSNPPDHVQERKKN